MLEAEGRSVGRLHSRVATANYWHRFGARNVTLWLTLLDEAGERIAVTIPDHVDVLCQLANGAQAHMRFSAATGLSPGNDVWLYGSEGTIHLDNELKVYGGRRGEQQLSEIPNPDDKQGYWRVEEEFVNAIRGQEQIARTPFDVGVHYMEFTEAVTRSAQSGRTVHLPL